VKDFKENTKKQLNQNVKPDVRPPDVHKHVREEPPRLLAAAVAVPAIKRAVLRRSGNVEPPEFFLG
jgi:hypothetical protein